MAEAGSDLVRAAGGILKFIGTYERDFARVVPSHVPVEAFIGMAASMVRNDTYLLRAAQQNPQALMMALREIAADGHLPRKGIASLVAYGKDITYIEEWRGVVERIYRAGGVQSVHCEVVRQNDHFQPRRGQLPVHEYDWSASKEERGPLTGVYSWAVMLTGGLSTVVLLNHHEMARIRSMSKSIKPKDPNAPAGGNFWGPEWPKEGPNTEAMWRKSALHRLEGMVPTSAAYRWQLAASSAAASQGFAGVPEASQRVEYASLGEDIQDAEILDERPNAGTAAANGGGWGDVQVAQPPDKGGK